MYILVIMWLIGSDYHTATLDHNLTYEDCISRIYKVHHEIVNAPIILSCEERK